MTEILNLTRKTAPTTTPVALADLKSHLALEVPDADARLSSLLDVAVDRFDGENGILARSLISQVWTFNLSDWPDDFVLLPYPPLVQINSVKYYDAANVQQTVSASNYYAQRTGQVWALAFISSFSMPTVYDRADAIEIEYTAGYGATPASVPAAIRHAILLQASELFGFRGDGEDSETAGADAAIERLIAPFKVRTWR